MGAEPHLARPPRLSGGKGGIGITLYLLAALFGLGLALALGARPKDLGGIELRAAWAFFLAALLEGGLAYGTYRGLFAPEVAGPLAKLLVLLLVGYGLYQNRHLKSLYLVLLGLLLNALVIFANGGHMPVSPTALHRAGIGEFADLLRDKGDAVHALLDEKTRLPFLGDVIPLPQGRQGDLFILLGIVGVVVEGALKGGVRLRRRALALRLLLYLAFVLALLALRG